MQHTEIFQLKLLYCISKQVEARVCSSKENVSDKELFELESILLNLFSVLKQSNTKLNYGIKT